MKYLKLLIAVIVGGAVTYTVQQFVPDLSLAQSVGLAILSGVIAMLVVSLLDGDGPSKWLRDNN